MKTRTRAAALAAYHAAYNNEGYTAIRTAIIVDIFGSQADPARHADHSTVIDLMNALIDTCLLRCGYPAEDPAHITLARMTVDARLSQNTIVLMSDYLHRFADSGITPADDFHAVAVALRQGNAAQRPLLEAVAHANAVHSWQGRAAYHLLAAADYLVQAALQLLVQGHPAYIGEKLGYGVRRLTNALEEGLRHSERPEPFDYSATDFPGTHDSKAQSRRPHEQAD